MSELVLVVLRFGFLALLWVFVFAVVYALRTDLFGQRLRKAPDAAAAQATGPAPSVVPAPAPAAPTPAPAAASLETQPVGRLDARGDGHATRLVITAGSKEGLEMTLPDDELTIGRASDSGLIIRDDYTSTHHARLLHWEDGWVVQDLDSTNGTFLDGKRVTVPTLVPFGVPVRIGTTSFELRR